MGLSFLVSNHDETKIGIPELKIISEVYDQHFSLPSHSSVEISLATVKEIREINNSYRNIDEPTDVLSFPTFNNLEDISTIPEGEPALLGAIIICPEKAEAYQETLLQLVHHGLLHIVGFDHETDLAQWLAVEKEVLSALTAHSLTIPGIPYDTL